MNKPYDLVAPVMQANVAIIATNSYLTYSNVIYSAAALVISPDKLKGSCVLRSCFQIIFTITIAIKDK